ncbi:MAG: hypothetical protein K0R90_500 [Oscillospiraceae bacterium]|nr:hypothetical protein [Oscillospiraceae bacterium]
MKTKEVNYFNLFIDGANVCNKAAKLFEQMLNGNVNKIPEMVKEIHHIEHEGDHLYHTLYNHLNLAFITPIEREDILKIAKYIEDTIDTIDEAAIMIDMLVIQSFRPEAKQMVDLIVKISSVLVEAATEFKNFKKSKKLTSLLVEINDIEEEGDKLYQSTIKHLFANEKDVLEVVKWKNIFDTMEDVLDACENAADIMENVILKNS